MHSLSPEKDSGSLSAPSSAWSKNTRPPRSPRSGSRPTNSAVRSRPISTRRPETSMSHPMRWAIRVLRRSRSTRTCMTSGAEEPPKRSRKHITRTGRGRIMSAGADPRLFSNSGSAEILVCSLFHFLRRAEIYACSRLFPSSFLPRFQSLFWLFWREKVF